MTDIAVLERELEGIQTINKSQVLRQKSRDYFWYSPVLNRQLDGLLGELLVVPRNEAEVLATVRVCVAHGVPITVRGAGTGNYGQAVPMQGGVILDLSEMTRILWIKPGAVRVEAGMRIGDLDHATQRDSGQEQRFHPSTRRLATIGGYVAGGSSGVGSVTWGILGDPGNILGIRVVTMEPEPRVLEMRGEEIFKVAHAYGTNGIITEVEMPLAPAYAWQDYLIGFDDFMEAVRYSHDLTAHSGILKKLVSPIPAPVPQQYFKALAGHVPEGKSIVCVMVAPQSEETFQWLTHRWQGEVLYRRESDDDGIPPIFEFTWNHTTLQALKVDRTITYLQSLFPPGTHLERVAHMYKHFGDEVPLHLEFVRFQGEIACFGLQMVRFTSEERLAEIISYHEANGVPIFNPHVYTVEEGGMKVVDRTQLAFKREADPGGLLNPGKMKGWDDPDFDARGKVTLFQ